jgi:cytochrome c biogenesis protein
VDRFAADYLPTGQANAFRADIGYQSAEDLAAGRVDEWRPYALEVNGPLRVDGVRVYLLGHGYAPRFTVTFPDGAQRTAEIQWRPVDPTTLLSEGATKFERPGLADEEQRRTSQLAVTGLFAPTSSGGDLVTSVFPEPRNPEVAVDVLRGDLGRDDGRGQSIFTVDRSQIESGELQRVARANLVAGEEVRLDDGTTVRFDGVREWVSLQVSHDPAQLAVLVFAVLLLVGLGLSLAVRRRRLWVRLTPVSGPNGRVHTVVEIGGLARTDRAGYGEEFDRLTADLAKEDPT